MAVAREIREEEPRKAAIVSRAALAKQQPTIVRALALGLWGVSLSGTLLFGGGGLGPWLTLHPNWWGVVAALAAQVVCSTIQWVWCREEWGVYYLGALALSSGSTIAGYWPLIFPPLEGWITRQDGALWHTYGSYIAGALIIVCAIIADVYPEKSLTQ